MRALQEGQKVSVHQGASREVHNYSELLSRMSKFIARLRPHQRNYHLCLRVNLYWYIEKHKEIELLMGRLATESRPDLREYLDTLCLIVSRKIEEDEKIAGEFLSGEADSK